MIKPYYDHAGIAIYHGDCREILPQLEPVDLVLTDPQYGMDTNVDNTRFRPKSRDKWWRNSVNRNHLQTRMPVYGDDKPFDPTHLLQFPKLITWGANHYSSRLPDSGGWFVWDKRKGIEDANWPLSEAELAWTNVCNGVRMFRHRWFGIVRESDQGQHYHPTQKPVALMSWCIQRVADSNLILDPYMGSGTTLRAAKDLGRKAIGIEIEEKYCEIAARRMSQEVLAL